MLRPMEVEGYLMSWRIQSYRPWPVSHLLPLNSLANSTVTKYLCDFRRWKTWAGSKGLEAVPAKPYLISLYLQHLSEDTNSKASVEEACNAVTWLHTTAGLSSPLM